MDRRTTLSPEDKKLRQKIRAGVWSDADLDWLLAHLSPTTPTELLQEVYAKRQQTDAGAVPQHGPQSDAASKQSSLWGDRSTPEHIGDTTK